MARRVAVDLTPQAVEQVAARVASCCAASRSRARRPSGSEPQGFLNVAQLAQHFGLNPRLGLRTRRRAGRDRARATGQRPAFDSTSTPPRTALAPAPSQQVASARHGQAT